MGIPSYFKKIIDDFPEIIKTKSFLKINFDNLFLDFNGCIHNCSNKLKSSERNFKNNIEFETELIKEVIKYTNEIFDFIKPTSLFYISIDGIPPRSKMIQQRYRRFMGQWKKTKIIEKLGKNKVSEEIIENYKKDWDSSAISPGTDFMNRLSLALKIHFKKTQKFKSIKVILSDSLEEGEGEFKIFKYIKENIKDNEHNIIHGLDADLIMLSLLQDKKIHLLREPVFFKLDNQEQFIFLAINYFKDILAQNYSHYFNNSTDLIYYYVFLCFLIGNDFIVNLTFLKFKNNSLEILLEIYRRISNYLNQNILIKKNEEFKINYLFLSKFINELSTMEDSEMKKATIEYEKIRPFFKKFDKNDKNEIIKKYDHELELYPILNRKKDNIQGGIDKNWRANYYYHIFDTTYGDEIRDICHNYLESLEFTLDYYYNQIYHKTWYYRYQYSPTILDLSNYIQSLNYTIINEEEQKYNDDFKINIEYDKLYPDINITSELQLLMILPPSSNHLINNKYRKLMINNDNGVQHYYPKDFKISTYLKRWLWLCKPMLPDIDLELLYKKYKEI